LNQTGVGVGAIAGILAFALGFYIFIAVFQPVMDDIVFPELDNASSDAMAYGSTIKLLFQLMPLALIGVGIIALLTGRIGQDDIPPGYP
jgi:ABC-type antimicrobial peptide transport system permease subunit